MAKFCGNCGAPMEDADKVCGQCGSPVMEITLDGDDVKRKKNRHNATIITAGVIAVVVLAVIVMNVASSFGGYERTLDKMVKALQEEDAEAMERLASSTIDAAIVDYLGDDIDYYLGSDLMSYYDDHISSAMDAYEERVGKVKNISYEIIDKEEISGSELKELKDELKDELEPLEDAGLSIKTNRIKKIVGVNLMLYIDGTDGSYSTDIGNLRLVKERNKWKIIYLFSDDFY